MTLLLLAGTAEARAVATALAERADRRVLASLAGVTASPRPLPVPTRRGGFGGAAGFRACLQDHGIRAVIDATHPFAARISARTARICAERGMPYLQLLRPPWVPGPEDRWTVIPREEAAAALIPPESVVFLATGQQRVARFAGIRAARVHIRRAGPGPAPFPFAAGGYVDAGPATEPADEIRLFRSLRVDLLVVRNAGGRTGQAKLIAARHLGLPVLMIDRPPQPKASRATTVAEALTWIDRL
ncbi:MAG: cobalt-precorrin-6A reductase [Qingshengfaniella sp.]